MLEADNGGVTARESLTLITEAASSKTKNALQQEVSENPEEASTRDCSVQYQTNVSPLGGKNRHRITVWLDIFGFLDRNFRSTDPLSRLILV